MSHLLRAGRRSGARSCTRVGDRPIVGYGPGAMRFGVSSLRESLGGRIALAQSHNSFFEALLAGGLVGAALWLGMMAALVRHVMALQQRFRPVAAGALTLLIVSSVTLGNLAGFGIPWFALMAVIGIGSSASVPSNHLERHDRTVSAVEDLSYAQ